MSIRIRRHLSVALFLLVFSASSGKLFAQATCSPDSSLQCGVSGGDPEPIGHVVTGGPVADDGDVVSGGDPEPIGHFVGGDDPDMEDAFLYALLVLFGMA